MRAPDPPLALAEPFDVAAPAAVPPRVFDSVAAMLEWEDPSETVACWGALETAPVTELSVIAFSEAAVCVPD
jgi:hypothetical protein